MGVVYKAEDLKLGRRVALKFLSEELADDFAARQRFESEARSASALNHPNICTIHEVDGHGSQSFPVMDLLEGQTLRDLIATMPPEMPGLELMKLLELAVQIAAGLEAAHLQGIIHRDIKPANISVTSLGQAKILDFGLAKSSITEPGGDFTVAVDRHEDGGSHEPKDESESLTASSPFLSRTGVAMGTAGYMSPEQVRGGTLDARTDLFSFGLVLSEMATGKRAFAGATAPELQKAILQQAITPAGQFNSALPAKLERIIGKTQEKDRESRYPTASELRGDLEALQNEIEPRPRARLLKTAAAAVVLVFLAAWVFWLAARRLSSQVELPEIKLKQLTSVSSQKGAESGGISPDGKCLAYGDRDGLHLQVIETAETQSIPLPEIAERNMLGFNVGAWLLDRSRFLANACPRGGDNTYQTSRGCNIWVVSVSGGPPHKIRDEATRESISPD